jgi:hypothetical protein
MMLSLLIATARCGNEDEPDPGLSRAGTSAGTPDPALSWAGIYLGTQTLTETCNDGSGGTADISLHTVVAAGPGGAVVTFGAESPCPVYADVTNTTATMRRQTCPGGAFPSPFHGRPATVVFESGSFTLDARAITGTYRALLAWEEDSPGQLSSCTVTSSVSGEKSS